MLKAGWWSSTQRWMQRLMALSGVLLGAVAWAHTPDWTQPASGALEVKLHGVPITVTASSVLPDAKDPGRYGPANLLDEDPSTIWAEGAKSTGAGEWVELSFPPGASLQGFLLTPGNPKSSKLYLANARPRKARLTLTTDEGGQHHYELEFPKSFPVGGALYVRYPFPWVIRAARLTSVSVWPGSKYRDLCIGTFVPVFRGPDEDSTKTFLGAGKDLAPTLATFVDRASLITQLMPAKGSGTSVWLRTYSKVPHEGAVPSSASEELDLSKTSLSEWQRYRNPLAQSVAAALTHNNQLRLTPAKGGAGYVLDPVKPPGKNEGASNFRVRWSLIEGVWRVVGLDLQFREETPDD